MAPPQQGSCLPLMAAPPGAFTDVELQVELRRLLWAYAAVLAVVVWVLEASLRASG
jgi:hypothetical protein